VKCSFINQHKNTWPVDLMCRLLGVKSHNYYSYQRRQTDKPDEPAHQEMLERVKGIASSAIILMGNDELKKVLNALSIPVSRRKTEQLMKAAGVWVWYKKKYKFTTNSEHNKQVYDNELK